MKKTNSLEDFIANKSSFSRKTSIMEARRKKDESDVKQEDVEGLSAEDNGSEGKWAVEPPTDDDLLKGIDRETLTKNKKRILLRMKANKPFFVEGRAGWGKTSIITKLAHQCKRTVITVYLDKIPPEDLGGTPVPFKSKKGGDYVKTLMPGWAVIMYDNPDTDYLLFFDEMNQADPQVMNALMPIVLKNVICGVQFKNFIVGGAGNLEDENQGGVNQLSKPLRSRFGGIIKWEDGDWASSFDFLHKKWDAKLGRKFVDRIQDNCECFDNPRDIDNHIIDTIANIKAGKEDADIFDASDWLDQLNDLAKEDLSHTQEHNLEELADYIYNYVNGNEDEDDDRTGSSKDINMVDEKVIAFIKKIMTRGWVEDPHSPQKKYGVSRENLKGIAEELLPNGELVEIILDKLEAEGAKFKYETNAEWKKANPKLLDPDAED